MLTDGRGNVLQVVLTRGNRNECKAVGTLVGTAVMNLGGRWPKRLAGDKGYSSDKVRRWLAGRRVRAVIPMRDTEHVKDRDAWPRFDKRAYRRRNVVERCVGRLKDSRRVATRYEKLAVNFLAVVHVAMIASYLRELFG